MTPQPDAASLPDPASAALARLGRTFQLSGALRCRPFDEAAADVVLRAQRLMVAGHGVLRVREAKRHGDALVVAFQGIRSPERAQALVNAVVYPDPDDHETLAALAAAQPLRPGLPVTLDGEPFGVVDAVLAGANPVLRVRSDDGLHLVPAHAPYVVITPTQVALRGVPAGLLDEPTAP